MKIRQKILMALMVLTSTVWASSKKSSQTTSFPTRSSKIPPKYQPNLMKKTMKVQSVSKNAPPQTRLPAATRERMKFLQGVLRSALIKLESSKQRSDVIQIIFAALQDDIPKGTTIS